MKYQHSSCEDIELRDEPLNVTSVDAGRSMSSYFSVEARDCSLLLVVGLLNKMEGGTAEERGWGTGALLAGDTNLWMAKGRGVVGSSGGVICSRLA